MKAATAALVAIGGTFAAVGLLQISGLALLGALSTSVATAARRPRRLTSWIPTAIIIAAMVAVVLAGNIVTGPHYGGD